MAQVIKKRIAKVILWILLSVFLLLTVVAGAIQIPYVQTKLVNYISNRLSEATNYQISITKINIDWFDQIQVQDLMVKDSLGKSLLSSSKVQVNYTLKTLLGEDPSLDELYVKDACILLKKVRQGDSIVLNINQFVKRLKDLSRKKEDKKTKTIPFTIQNIELENSRFSYQDPFRKNIEDGFNYHNFSIQNINAGISGFYSLGDTISLEVQDLTGKDSLTDLSIDRIKTKFFYSNEAMRFHELDLIIGKSRIKESIDFKYRKASDLNNFVSAVTINAELKNSLIHNEELGKFVPIFKNFDEYYDVTGVFKGRISSLQIKELDLKFSGGSIIRGDARIVGLPSIDETFIDLDLVNSYAVSDDLKKYLKEKTFRRLAPLKNIGFNANFFGFLNDFVATGDFFTQYGRITSDINLKLNEEVNKSSYRGALKMLDFDIGGYTSNELLGKVTLDGIIQGKGFTLDKADFILNGRIDSIELNQYSYHNIQTNARFTKEFFEGEVRINDTNLKMDLNGSIDVRGGLDFFNIQAKLDTAFLDKLNLTSEQIFVRSNLNVNAQGLKLDDILGSANFKNTIIQRDGQELIIDSLGIISDRDENIRNVFINTNLFNCKIDGEFDFSIVYDQLNKLLYEYRLSLENNRESLKDYYENKPSSTLNYQVNYVFNINNFEPISRVFIPDLYISPATSIDGNLVGGFTSILNMNSFIDSVNYKNDYFLNNELQLNISKISDSTSVLASLYATSEKERIAGIETKDLFAEAIWTDRHIDFEFDIDQVRYPNYVRLMGEIDFLEDTTSISFLPSDIHVLEDKWSLRSDNLITISGKEIGIRDLTVYHKNQQVKLEGQLSETRDKQMTLTLDSIDIGSLNSIISKDLGGLVNGTTSLTNYYQDMRVTSDINIAAFSVNEFVVGDIVGNNVWNNENQNFDVSFFIEREDEKVLDVYGIYSPKYDNLELKAVLNQTELKILEPFLDSYFTEISGTATGEVIISGALRTPELDGTGKMNQVALHVNYLNTDYTIDGDFYLNKSQIGFRNTDIRDRNNNKGSINGYIEHEGFKDMSINMRGTINDFTVLNTSAKDNDLFYGTGVATGSIEFLGPMSNMEISANATTGRGTRIFIPVGGSTNIEQEEYINFVDLNDTTQSLEFVNEKVNLKGLNLDFDLNITRDAYCEIIFDIKAGDIIRGRGNGDLKLQINTNGDFNMFGDYTIEEGGYNFTLYNIINKEFEILPESKISWFGDPYEGVMDITATYNQVASFMPILTNPNLDYSNSPEIRRNYPVQVLLDIDGRLLSPQVEFDIVAENLPRNIQVPIVDGGTGAGGTETVDLELAFAEFKNSIDEQELKRQVFSLIILKKFSPLQSFNTGGSISSSVSELLSNQLSYWVTQVDENLEIDIDLGALDSDAYNTFQLRLSYTFLDGRLRVTRDGGFTNQQNRADINSIAGDWTVEYLLTPNGKFKAKMYNRTNYNPINRNEETQNTTTTGFSLIHTQNFDEIKELFQRSRNQSKKNTANSTSETSQTINRDKSDLRN
ncbi:MAG: translocation/assembly module TamB domain-containing protein [Bacteroidota bacterium]